MRQLQLFLQRGLLVVVCFSNLTFLVELGDGGGGGGEGWGRSEGQKFALMGADSKVSPLARRWH